MPFLGGYNPKCFSVWKVGIQRESKSQPCKSASSLNFSNENHLSHKPPGLAQFVLKSKKNIRGDEKL